MQFDENFWLDIESEQLKIKQVKNKAVKTNGKDKVYYYSKDAQSMYDLYCGYLKDYKQPVKGELIDAKLVSILGDNAIFDIGYREFAYMDLNKESSIYKEYFKTGNILSVKVDLKKDFVSVSFTESANENKLRELINSINKPEAFTGRIVELVSAGYMVDIDGILAFMPGSLAGLNKLTDFTALLGKQIPVCAVNYSKEKNTVVVSHRQYLHFLIPSTIENLRNNLKNIQTGTVTGCTQYGVFCEFNECLTGMIHSADLTDDLKEKLAAGKIKAGDKLEFYIKEIINNFKITLTQFYKENPWDNAEEKYRPFQLAVGKITSVKEYGAFIELEPGISGLLPSNEFNKNLKEGDKISVRINKIDIVNKKVYLSVGNDFKLGVLKPL
jgi:small subunit ribosomal protein S1